MAHIGKIIPAIHSSKANNTSVTRCPADIVFNVQWYVKRNKSFSYCDASHYSDAYDLGVDSRAITFCFRLLHYSNWLNCLPTCRHKHAAEHSPRLIYHPKVNEAHGFWRRGKMYSDKTIRKIPIQEQSASMTACPSGIRNRNELKNLCSESSQGSWSLHH